MLCVSSSGAERRGWLGYGLVSLAACLFAVNGVVSKVILSTGISPQRLIELRVTGACVGLALVLAAMRPGSLSVTRAELPLLAVFGVLGVAIVQWSYFVAIERLEIGIALLIQYLAPLGVALFSRLVLKRSVRPRIWVALGLALVGLSLVVEIWTGSSLDGLGVAASVLAAGTFALYILLAERGVGERDPFSLTLYGFLFGAVFWLILQPPWSFPVERLGDDASLLGTLEGLELPVWLLSAWMVVLGTIVPFVLVASALRHISATRAGIAAMLEPVVAILVAYAWLEEALSGAQLAGAGIVLGAIALAQTARAE